ncbi:putative ribosome-binding factor A, mitochondrial, partial [Stegodyphus mimosarum]
MNRCRIGLLSIYSPLKQSVRFEDRRVNQVHKRGSMLQKLIVNKDKKKNWHASILANKPTSKNVFEKVHNPSRRENVLNSVFIKNITDVLSTGEVVPEILGYGVEITGVKVSPCCRILNVYWRIPPHYYEASEEITEVLTIKAPKVRSELISRNVIGRVPRIFFVRDISNARSSALEEAMQKIDFGPKDNPDIVPDDSFLKDIYSFKTPKMEKVEEKASESDIPKKSNSVPQNPTDMKSNVFGLQHDILMDRVITSKKKSKLPTPP